MSERRSFLLAGVAGGAVLAAALAGCGFELRRTPPMPFSTIALRGFLRHSPMADELRRTLSSSVTVTDVPADAQVVLESILDQREKVVVDTSASAQVRDLQLRVRFNFRLVTPTGRQLLAPDELVLIREISYNETNALAKEKEEEELYRAMQSDIVSQVVRRLAAAKPT